MTKFCKSARHYSIESYVDNSAVFLPIRCFSVTITTIVMQLLQGSKKSSVLSKRLTLSSNNFRWDKLGTGAAHG